MLIHACYHVHVYTDLILFEFGEDVGDQLVPELDDGHSPPILLQQPFQIFQENETILFVCEYFCIVNLSSNL